MASSQPGQSLSGGRRRRRLDPDESERSAKRRRPDNMVETGPEQTFGIEFEFLLPSIYESDMEDPFPIPGKEVNFRKYCERKYKMIFDDRPHFYAHCGSRDFGLERIIPATIFIADLLRFNGIPACPEWAKLPGVHFTLGNFLESLKPEDRDGWIVTTDRSLRASLEEDWVGGGWAEYEFLPIELVSPPLKAPQNDDDIPVIRKVLDLITERTRAVTNLSCGMHVHVGRRDDPNPFTIDEFRVFYAMAWTFESAIHEIMPGYRIGLGEGAAHYLPIKKVYEQVGAFYAKPLRIGYNKELIHPYFQDVKGTFIAPPSVPPYDGPPVDDDDIALRAKEKVLTPLIGYSYFFKSQVLSTKDDLVFQLFTEELRYSSYNFMNFITESDGSTKKTIEFRQFPGCLEANTVVMWVSFCNAMMRKARYIAASPTTMESTIFAWQEFVKKEQEEFDASNNPPSSYAKTDKYKDFLKRQTVHLHDMIGLSRRDRETWAALVASEPHNHDTEDFDDCHPWLSEWLESWNEWNRGLVDDLNQLRQANAEIVEDIATINDPPELTLDQAFMTGTVDPRQLHHNPGLDDQGDSPVEPGDHWEQTQADAEAQAMREHLQLQEINARERQGGAGFGGRWQSGWRAQPTTQLNYSNQTIATSMLAPMANMGQGAFQSSPPNRTPLPTNPPSTGAVRLTQMADGFMPTNSPPRQTMFSPSTHFGRTNHGTANTGRFCGECLEPEDTCCGTCEGARRARAVVRASMSRRAGDSGASALAQTQTERVSSEESLDEEGDGIAPGDWEVDADGDVQMG